MAAMTIAEALAWAINSLAGGESPQLDARVLLAHCLDREQIYLHTWPEKALSDAEQRTFEQAIKSRQQGIPVAYLTGVRDFWTLELEVAESTLIPRPDTEVLVEHALSLDLPAKATVLDLGTGTGAIALALASEHPDWHITAVDKVSDAVALAERNRVKHNLSNVTVQQSDWFGAIDAKRRFDLIISNPPYVEDASPWLSEGDVRFEPRSALTAGADGLLDIRHICTEAVNRLTDGGWLMLEHGYQQGEQVQALMRKNRLTEVLTLVDLSGLSRATVGRKTH